MTITKIEYISVEQSTARLIYDDGRAVTTALPSGDGPTQRDIDAALAGGLAIAAYVPPPAPEPMVHVAWLRAALAEVGKLTAVDEVVAASGPVPEQLWTYATTIRRGHPMVAAIATPLNLDLDALFSRAEALRALNS